MVTVSQLRDTPAAFYHSDVHWISSSSKREGAIRYNDELQNRAKPSAALPPPRARSLLAVVATIFAIVYLAYVCSFSIGRRITALPLSRSLAQSSGGEDCGESDGSHSTGSPAETSPEGQFTTDKQLDYAVEGLKAQSGNTEPIPSSDATTAAPGKAISGTAARQLETQGRRTGFKRKGEEQSTAERGAKKLIRETPIVEAPLQPGPPPIDPRLDSLIDSVLSGGSTVFSEAFWLLNEAQLKSVEDDYIESRPGTLGTDSRTPVVETPQRPPPTPLDPGLDSLIDSVLSESADILSGDAWLLDDEPPHPTPDYSILSIPPTLGGDSERPGADQAPGKAEYVLPPMTSVLPNYGKGREEEVGGEPPLPRNALGSLLQRELPAGAETVDSGPSPDTADATKESLQELTAEAPTSPKAGMASTPEGAVDHYSAPSSRTSASPRQLPAGVRLSQESQSVEQSSSMIDLPTDATVISRFAWLSEFLPAVPIDVMRTHPFYRHPQHQEERLIRQSSAPFAALFRPIKRNAGPALAMCYTLMKQPFLNRQDIGKLLKQSGRLCAYAVQNMPVTNRREQSIQAMDTLGTIFFVLDTLYCAAEVLGDCSIRQSWWPLIMRRIETARFVPNSENLSTEKSYRNADIARTLNTALEYYRRGLRPPVAMVVGLKEALLREPGSSKFKAEMWNLWRDDADQWRESVQRSVTEDEVSTRKQY